MSETCLNKVGASERRACSLCGMSLRGLMLRDILDSGVLMRLRQRVSGVRLSLLFHVLCLRHPRAADGCGGEVIGENLAIR
jgi:hypothetical protein